MTLKVFGTENEVQALFDGQAVGIKRPKAIRFKHGVLSPGAYINNRALPSHSAAWRIVNQCMVSMARALLKDFDVIASVATGGIIHGGVIAWEVGKPHVIVKKQEKTEHGLGGLIDGDGKILPGARVLLVEDMSSTFESSLKAMEPLMHEGATIAHTILLNTWNLPDFKRNIETYSVFALCTGEELLKRAVAQKLIDEEHEQIMWHWLEHPEDESWSQDGRWILP